MAHSADFFSILSAKLFIKEPRDMLGVWRDKEVSKGQIVDEFQPCLRVQVRTRENTRTEQLIAKAYFFDERRNLIAACSEPSKSGRKSQRPHFEIPDFLVKDTPASIFFQIPDNIADRKWTAVIVFGDSREVVARCYPSSQTDFLFAYPEKEFVYGRAAKRAERRPAMDPLIEHPVETRNPKMPQITLFLRAPRGISDPTEVEGVLAICVLTDSLFALKRLLQKEEMSGDYQELFEFADKHKLAILAWGSRSLWNPSVNDEDLSKVQAKEIDESFDIVADAWERGVKQLSEKYGLPQSNFLLWGASASAQWAKRLCLRKPNYFLAIHIHVPSSFDNPTPEASDVLWCLTTGEREVGYARSRRFYSQCRALGYPIIYKAIIGLGHSGHRTATRFGFAFYEFALGQQRQGIKRPHNSLTQESRWQKDIRSMFERPPFYGDLVNQEVFPKERVGSIPEAFRVPLPTKELADIWSE